LSCGWHGGGWARTGLGCTRVPPARTSGFFTLGKRCGGSRRLNPCRGCTCGDGKSGIWSGRSKGGKTAQEAAGGPWRPGRGAGGMAGRVAGSEGPRGAREETRTGSGGAGANVRQETTGDRGGRVRRRRRGRPDDAPPARNHRVARFRDAAKRRRGRADDAPPGERSERHRRRAERAEERRRREGADVRGREREAERRRGREAEGMARTGGRRGWART
jgi:hypothetical protein